MHTNDRVGESIHIYYSVHLPVEWSVECGPSSRYSSMQASDRAIGCKLRMITLKYTAWHIARRHNPIQLVAMQQ